MKLDPIKREHLIQAADELDNSSHNSWAEYWLHISERQKDYPFKVLVRRAYEIATGMIVSTDFFQSNTSYRNYISQQFGYKVFFKIRDNIDFITDDEIEFFMKYGDQPYRTDNKGDKAAGEILKKTVFLKTNVWANALNIQDFEVQMDNQWQISGTFKHYTWARIFRYGDRNKKVFFTVGIDAHENVKGLVFKLDCQRQSYNPQNALSKEQIGRFDRLVPVEAKWVEITREKLIDYDWQRLIEQTKTFIEYYIPLYDEAVAAIWSSTPRVTKTVGKLRFCEVPPGKLLAPPLRKRATGGKSNPDYDAENKAKKDLGTAGEEIVKGAERDFLRSKGRDDLAKLVDNVPDWKGYDIDSFDEKGIPKKIEVKTTTGSVYREFVFTANERRAMIEESEHYYLYRLYNYDYESDSADCFVLPGNFLDRVVEEPIQYYIHLKKI
ncbi:MAG: DUF3883 domain-containing protein [Sediminibacterium sp.]|nr:DUF3883 domain-containing protein [uncultured Sediminibacterium sp.]